MKAGDKIIDIEGLMTVYYDEKIVGRYHRFEIQYSKLYMETISGYSVTNRQIWEGQYQDLLKYCSRQLDFYNNLILEVGGKRV